MISSRQSTVVSRQSSWIALALIAMCSTVLRADVTITMTTTLTMEGAPNISTARAITRIKGTKSRTDSESQGATISTIVDLTTGRVIHLIGPQKIAQVSDAPTAEARETMPNVDLTLEPTGRSQTFFGQRCDEFKVSMSVDMAQRQMSKEAAETFKDARLTSNGVVWVSNNAPGAAEYVAFQKRAIAANLPGTAQSSGSVDLNQLFARAEGITCLTDFEVSLEGGSPLVDAFKLPMKLTSKVTEVSLAPIADEVFKIPAEYTVTKP
jgi:hypothetical protein